MNRPEGISESAWEKAVNELGPSGVHVYGISYPMIVERVARAIQSSVEAERAAERERCADIADEMRRKHGSPSGDAYDNGLWDQGVRIAQMIRKGA